MESEAVREVLLDLDNRLVALLADDAGPYVPSI